LFVGSFLLGAQTLRELALALFIGLTTGTYSSIFLATPLVAAWKEREERWQKLRSRIAARRGEPVASQPARVITAQPAPVPVPSATMEVRDVITPPPSRLPSQAQQARPASGGGGGSSSRAKKRK
jgi:preprotein translocase subunit SecF